MGKNSARIAILNGVLMILFGMFFAGVALGWLITRDVYGQAVPVDVGGDYRGWLMAHLQGLLNGIVVIVLALGTRIKQNMPEGREKWLLRTLLLMGWGNVIAAAMAPVFGVRGMAFDDNIANNITLSIFSVAFFATFYAFYAVIRHLWTPDEVLSV